MDVNVRKTQAGADSFGNTWPEDGAVVPVPYEQAVILLAIQDGGFSVVDTPAEDVPSEDPQPVPDPEPDSGEAAELSEIDPDAPASEPVAEPESEAKPAAKKTAARKTAASRKTVEE
ncbi:hypothetical protein ACFXKC_40855 [Streptomyces sp. NPDC059340]|uniref:hypothetical protein n=1 Tax=Streptomyces sp. NPDC059340 TaxID=3346806 RepID=UPI003692823B